MVFVHPVAGSVRFHMASCTRMNHAATCWLPLQWKILHEGTNNNSQPSVCVTSAALQRLHTVHKEFQQTRLRDCWKVSPAPPPTPPKKKSRSTYSILTIGGNSTPCNREVFKYSCPCTQWGTPLGKVSARLETAAWYMASQLVGGTASESTESVWVLCFKALSGSPVLVQTCTAGSYGKQEKHKWEKILFACFCVCLRNKWTWNGKKKRQRHR